MEHIDQETRLIEETIQQLLSGLDKTFVPFTDDQIWNDDHITFAQRLDAVCEQDYRIMISADRLICKRDIQWLVVENLGEYQTFPSIRIND